ncbi:hypothetical protein [Desulforapulum autotrophicum]|nr:hypothetical protein [Desulforapulum autotrophicum]
MEKKVAFTLPSEMVTLKGMFIASVDPDEADNQGPSPFFINPVY